METKRIIDVLEQCERGLKGLLAEAAGEADYPAVERILELAKVMSGLVLENRGVAVPGSAVAAPALSGLRDRRKVSQEQYPRFFRRGDELVKVGWSKKDRKEYNHRAPRAAVDAAAAAVRQVGAKGKVFNGDALLPLKDMANGNAIPDYQGYVALAWFKQLGLVVQEGKRSGYTLNWEKPIESTISAAWPELAEWRG